MAHDAAHDVVDSAGQQAQQQQIDGPTVTVKNKEYFRVFRSMGSNEMSKVLFHAERVSYHLTHALMANFMFSDSPLGARAETAGGYNDYCADFNLEFAPQDVDVCDSDNDGKGEFKETHTATKAESADKPGAKDVEARGAENVADGKTNPVLDDKGAVEAGIPSKDGDAAEEEGDGDSEGPKKKKLKLYNIDVSDTGLDLLVVPSNQLGKSSPKILLHKHTLAQSGSKAGGRLRLAVCGNL